MFVLDRKPVVMLLTGVLLGCSTQGAPRNSQQALEMAAAGPESSHSVQRPDQDPQQAYRRELLNNQLRHAQLDLQSASNESERQSVQQRIDMIQHMLDSLDRR